MILVAGATEHGLAGGAGALGAAPVRAFVRDPEKRRARLGVRGRLAIGDFANPESFRAVLDGADELVPSCADYSRRVKAGRQRRPHPSI